MLKRMVGIAIAGALCAALAGCASGGDSQRPLSEQAKPNAPTAAQPADSCAAAEPEVRTGKDQVTVLVLNGCGIEGAAGEAADKVRVAGYEHVTVDNATYYNHPQTIVSYRYEEQRPDVEVIEGVLGVSSREGMYLYEPGTGGWGNEYDILVMLGEPVVAGDPRIPGGSI